MTNKEKLEHDAKLLAKCEEWLEGGDTWLGVFENHDLGHPEIGRLCIFPFSMSDGSWEGSKELDTRAPDGKSIGMGWRYILILKTRDAKEAVNALLGKEESDA